MSRRQFNAQQWESINASLQECLACPGEREPFGLPERRDKSVVLGTFNLREFGRVRDRSAQAWDFLKMICGRFDLLHIQEVQDNLESIRHLRELLGDDYGLVVSDTTGQTPGSPVGSSERLAFLFRWARVKRTELASDISYDRASVVETLYRNRAAFDQAWQAYDEKLAAWQKDSALRKAAGKKPNPKPTLALPAFLTFIRQPHCASFEVVPQNGAQPCAFLAINAHLLYGENDLERRWEFDALVDWLTNRAKMVDEPSYRNLIMMGDCNFDFKTPDERTQADTQLKALNGTALAGEQDGKANFPLLDRHPTRGDIRTNTRKNQTYDQIAFFTHNNVLPRHKDNACAGSQPDGYDYGAFRFIDLFAQALFGQPRLELLNKADQACLVGNTEWDISDHMPAWVRLPVPGAV